MRHFLIAIAALAVGAPAVAADSGTAKPAELHTGQILRDADMAKLGPISDVRPDGSVQIIYQQRLLTLPASTLSVVDGKAKTSLSRHDLSTM